MATEATNNENMMEFLTGDEIAQLLNVSRAFAYGLIQRKEIRALRMGKCVRVRRCDLEEYIVRKSTTVRGTRRATA